MHKPTRKLLSNKAVYLPIAIAALMIQACGDDTAVTTDQADSTKVEVDSNKANLLSVNGAVFSIPSPIQTSMLLKQTGTNYNKDILNDPNNYSRYSTRFQKAVNLGIYGADLGYVTMYEQTNDALNYLSAVRKMADELGVTGAFDMTLASRFEKNMGNRDSLLSLVSDAYRASDNYLKNNDQNDVGALILAGGWIESVYFATKVAQQTKNPEVIRRIAEQKNTLDNLIKLLGPYYQDQAFTGFIDNLLNLSEDFEQIQFTYVYEQPTVDAQNKTTIINSRTEVNISDEQLSAITKKIETIRNQIVG